MSHYLKRLWCRLAGHRPYQSRLLVAGQDCTSPVYCDRCFAVLKDGGAR